jgi:hypothetical protein
MGDVAGAVEELEVPQLDINRAFSFSPRLFEAYADALTAAGRADEAAKWYRQIGVAESALGVGEFEEPDILDFGSDEEDEEEAARPSHEEAASASADEADDSDEYVGADDDDEDGGPAADSESAESRESSEAHGLAEDEIGVTEHDAEPGEAAESGLETGEAREGEPGPETDAGRD